MNKRLTLTACGGNDDAVHHFDDFVFSTCRVHLLRTLDEYSLLLAFHQHYNIFFLGPSPPSSLLIFPIILVYILPLPHHPSFHHSTVFVLVAISAQAKGEFGGVSHVSVCEV